MKQATAPSVETQLYPDLPTSEMQGESYRLQQVSLLKQRLEEEREKRAALYKKYHRGVNAVDGIDTALLAASMAMGASGVGLLSTVISAPIVLGLEAAALLCGLLGIGGKFVGKKLQVKAQKHNDIAILADSKLNTISDHISKALRDGSISDEEFKLVLDECEKYQQMKADIRAGSKKKHLGVRLDDEAKKALIAQGREEAHSALLQKLGASSS